MESENVRMFKIAEGVELEVEVVKLFRAGDLSFLNFLDSEARTVDGGEPIAGHDHLREVASVGDR